MPPDPLWIVVLQVTGQVKRQIRAVNPIQAQAEAMLWIKDKGVDLDDLNHNDSFRVTVASVNQKPQGPPAMDGLDEVYEP